MWIALGGLALLMLGLQQMSKALSSALGGSARRALTWATASATRATLIGGLIGAGTLNSGALSLSALQLAENGVARFEAALMLGLAAKAGASVALLIANTPIAVIALPLIAVGYGLSLIKKFKIAGEAIGGIGLLLYGLSLMVQGFSGMTNNDLFILLRNNLESVVFGVWLLGFAISGVLGSANAIAAIALALVHSSALSLEAALALTLGGGAGSGVLLVISSLNGTAVIRRVAWTHITWKTLLSLLALPAVPLISTLFSVAQVHVFYHTIAALLALPLTKTLSQIAIRLIPERNRVVAPKYLSSEALSSSHLAIALALREVSRIGDQLIQMLEQTTRILETGEGDTEDIARREAKIDLLTREVVLYLSDLGSRHLSETPLMLVMAVSEIEHMADQVRRILRMHNKLIVQNLEFSIAGRAELTKGAERVLGRLHLSLAALATRDKPLAEQVISEREDLEHFLTDLRRSHLKRLESGSIESRATTLTHLDLMIVLDEIDQGSARIATISQDLEPIFRSKFTVN